MGATDGCLLMSAAGAELAIGAIVEVFASIMIVLRCDEVFMYIYVVVVYRRDCIYLQVSLQREYIYIFQISCSGLSTHCALFGSTTIISYQHSFTPRTISNCFKDIHSSPIENNKDKDFACIKNS